MKPTIREGETPGSTQVRQVLDVSGLTVTFETGRGSIRAVRGIEFNVSNGQAMAIVGESGSGKSVSLLAVAGLLPASAEVRGSAVLEGRDLLSMKARELRHVRGTKMGFVFQDPATSLNPVLTIGRQITEPLRIHRDMSRREARRRATEVLDLVGVSEPERRLDQYPHELSGGLRQRVMIGSALAREPILLIADEPTTALDVTIQAQVLELLADLQQQFQMAIILVTHDLGVAASLAEHINVMYSGYIVETAPAVDLLRAPRHPYTKGLLAAAPRIGDRRSRLTPISGQPPDARTVFQGCPFEPRCPFAFDRCRHEVPPLFPTGKAGHAAACFLEDQT